MAAAGFFCLLCGYYMLRPIREAMALEVGREYIRWLFTTVLLVSVAILPLYWWLVGRTPRRLLLWYVYGPFVVGFLAIAVGFALYPGDRTLAFVYFVALSSANLFIISVFWSSMADVWPPHAAKRFFGYVAAGGSLGALLGPIIVNSTVRTIGPTPLMFVACGFILCTILLVASARTALRNLAGPDGVPDSTEAVGGRALDDLARLFKTPYMLGIAAIVVVSQTLGAFMYNEQAKYAEQAYASLAERTALFSRMEFAVSLLALFFQAVVVGWLTRRGSVRWSLSAMPIVIAATFVLLALFPVGAVLLVTQVIRRAADYGLGKPVREMLFTVVNVESKFKSKSLIDTVLQRGTDATSQWLYTVLTTVAGMGIVGLSWMSAAICLALVAATRSLGNAFETRTGEVGPPRVTATSDSPR
jgi:AAA family ATP:ADP antiporter